MTKIPDVVKKAISEQKLFCVATSTSKGIPNVVYIKYLKVVDDRTILIADNYFNKTRDNILSNGKIAFAVLDKEKGSFQIKGTARRLTEGDMFDEVQRWVTEKLPKAAAIVIKVEEIYNGAEIIH